MKLINEIQLDFNDVMILPKRSTLTTRKTKEYGGVIDLEREFIFPHTNKTWKGVPIIAANMLTGTFEMARTLAKHKMLTALHKHYTVDQLVSFWQNENEIAQTNTFYSLGITNADYIKYNAVCEQLGYTPNFVLCDVANGHMEIFVDFIKKLRNENPNIILMAGNVVTGSMAEELTIAGADLIKCGIGSGQNCLTRRVTGCGRPQLSAVFDVSDHTHGLKSHCVSDGGCSEGADINIAFCGGADFVMLGSMLSGTDECDGEIIEQNGIKYKKFFGMSSITAQEQYNGGKSEYRPSEGRTTLIPYKGSVNTIINEIKGGMASMMSYIGAEKLKEVPKRATLQCVNNRLNTSLEKYTIGN